MEEAADASRRALCEFLRMEPSKLSLSAWLVGPYREATCFRPRRIRTAHRHALGAHRITPMNVEDLVTMAKSVVIAALAAARRGVDDLVVLLPPVVQVVPAHDVYGNHGFVPIDEARMRLVDRVLALLVADYLTRPNDFQADRPPISGTHSTNPWVDFGLRGGAIG